MKKILITLLFSTILFLTGCGQMVEVPPANVGKILTKNGFSADVIQPSKFRLDPCIPYCDSLIILQAGDIPMKETMVVFMPQDKLNLTVEIRGTFSIPNDPKSLNMLFDRIPAEDNKISFERVYLTYGQPAIRGIVRNEIVKYTIADVLANRDAIGQNIHTAIVEKLVS